MGETGSVTSKGARRISNRYFNPSNTVSAASHSCLEQKKALTTHYNVSHLHKRDFTCPHEDCGKSYGYKHLLQRHVAHAHLPEESSDCSSDGDDDNAKGVQTDIEVITGKSYLARNARIRRALRCPHPNLPPAFVLSRDSELSALDSVLPCEHVFGRAYDLRRHLLSKHGLAVEKGIVDAWAEDRWTLISAEGGGV